MRELSLFTGAGGGVLGTKLLGWETVGYVEINEYCQKVIAQRIKDGILDQAPIFGDIRSFISQGYARSYQGMVDVVTAGFPCQPFSTAGHGLGHNDERNMWPETVEAIRQVRPTYCLLENVTGLLTHQYFGVILADLAQGGYSTRWDCLPAAAVGAPHIRDRVWLFAYPRQEHDKISSGIKLHGLLQQDNDWTKEEWREDRQLVKLVPGIRDGISTDWWRTQSSVARSVNGMADRLDRLSISGNGQVPLVVKTVWELLGVR